MADVDERKSICGAEQRCKFQSARLRVEKIGSKTPSEIYSQVRSLIPGREEYKEREA